jgi:hypothetical protein
VRACPVLPYLCRFERQAAKINVAESIQDRLLDVRMERSHSYHPMRSLYSVDAGRWEQMTLFLGIPDVTRLEEVDPAGNSVLHPPP